jgi:hypothetical protein
MGLCVKSTDAQRSSPARTRYPLAAGGLRQFEISPTVPTVRPLASSTPLCVPTPRRGRGLRNSTIVRHGNRQPEYGPIGESLHSIIVLQSRDTPTAGCRSDCLCERLARWVFAYIGPPSARIVGFSNSPSSTASLTSSGDVKSFVVAAADRHYENCFFCRRFASKISIAGRPSPGRRLGLANDELTARTIILGSTLCSSSGAERAGVARFIHSGRAPADWHGA